MRTFSKLLIAGLLTAVSFTCPVLSQSGSISELPWSRFEWIGFDIGSKHFNRAAMAVPIKIEGIDERYFLQHDLGAERTMLFEVPYRQALEKAGKTAALDASITINATIGNSRIPNMRAFVRMGHGDPLTPGDKTPLIGTLGLDFFAQRILLLDYQAQRLAVLPDGSSLPSQIEKKASFVPINLRNGKLFVPVILNGKEYPDDFFFDTGSSLFALATTKDLWQILTGRDGSEKDNEIWRLPSWGKEAVLIGAPLSQEIRVGAARLSRPNIFYNSSGLPNLDFAKYPFKASGLIGNELFFDGYLVIVDIPHKRFGVMPTSENAGPK